MPVCVGCQKLQKQVGKMWTKMSCLESDVQSLAAFKILRGSAGREPFRSLGMCSRERSRSRSRSRAKRLADRFAIPKGRFVPWWENKDAAARQWRCFNEQCPRVWTTAPYQLWVHFSCSDTACIAYLHEETTRIQTELQSLDTKERESIIPMKCSGR